MASIGWIKTNRELQQHWLWEDKPFSRGQAWIDLIMLANHKNNKFVFNGELIEVERGSFITSEVKLMERWGWSKTKVRNFLDMLENDSMLVKKTDHRKTTLSIVNYSVYQDFQTSEEPVKDQRKTSEELVKDTNKNDKNEKNEKKILDSTSEVNFDSDLIVEKFNSTCKSLPSIRSLSDQRKKTIKAWIKQDGYDAVIEVFEKTEASDFLSGRSSNPERPWKASFDWITKPANRIKILEGNYDNNLKTKFKHKNITVDT